MKLLERLGRKTEQGKPEVRENPIFAGRAADAREEEYQKAGWRHDPFPEELEEEDEEEEEDWHYHSMEERLNEVGMSMREFF